MSQIEIIPKGSNKRLSTNIMANEADCQCVNISCEHTLYCPELLEKFELLRESCGNKPIYITSAFRCHSHNKWVGGVAKSSHKIAMALDLVLPLDMSMNEFVNKCREHFHLAIPYRAERFVHCSISTWRE